MTKKTTRIICIVLAVLLVFGLIAAVIPSIPANAVTQAEIDALQAQRDEIKSQQDDIQEQIDVLEAEMASVVEQKAALDEQNELNRQDIELIDQQIELYDEMIEEKAREVDDAIAAEEAQFAHYCARVRTMEETNSWTYISVLLQANSLTDFLSRLNDIVDIVRSDQNVKEEYIAAREHVQEVKAEYEEVQAQQKDKREELLDERAQLEEQIDQAESLISLLEDDIEGYEAAFEEIEAKRSDIQARIDEKVAALQKQKEAEEAARRAYEASLRARQQTTTSAGSNTSTTTTTTTASGAGYFVWPSNATYITSRFGYRVHPIFGTTKYHAGVDIAAAGGSTVAAAAGGTVQISEYSDSYGNYCVIYHSNGTTTLYAHMNSLPVVKVGETVSAGQTIGYVGSTGWATGPHLHFEVRVNGSCVDPISYFPGGGFSYAADA